MKTKLLSLLFIIICGQTFSQGLATITLFKNISSAPNYMAIDGNDNIYVSAGNQILKITPSAVTTTLAGTSTGGNLDGIGAAAQFSVPAGLCVDPSGNVYVADRGNHNIRKITPTGSVTTIAGTGVAGTVNATGTLASFSDPKGICLAPNGDLFVLDGYITTARIRKINPSGLVSTLYNIGIMVTSDISYINNLIYFSNPGLGTIYRIDPLSGSPTLSIAIGTGSSGHLDGDISIAKLSDPTSFCTDNIGNFFIADNGGHRIRLASFNSGSVTTIAGNGGVACPSSGSLALSQPLWSPRAIVRASNGELFIGDYFCNSIFKLSGVISPVNVEEKQMNFNFHTYPNPTSSELNINLKENSKTDNQIEYVIKNILGETMMQGEIVQRRAKIDVSALNKGCYILYLKSAGVSVSTKFIKE